MPLISKVFIRTGLIYCVVALLLGGARWLGLLGVDPGWWAAGGPAQLHLFMYGWVTHVIIGVALWLFPVADRSRPRGRAWLNWTAFVAINLGLVSRFVAEPAVMTADPAYAWRVILVGSALLQTVGGLAFVLTIWPRVKTR